MVSLNQVEITHPERWWLATATLMPWLTDPDVDDGGLRHADRHEIRWDTLAKILTEISGRIQRRQYATSTSRSHAIKVRFASPVGDLTDAETEILESWFTSAESPRADAWDSDLENGRHRLWNVWDHDKTAWLPIRSSLLDYLDDVDEAGAAFAATIRQSANHGLALLPPIVAKRSPQYVAALEHAQTVSPSPGQVQ